MYFPEYEKAPVTAVFILGSFLGNSKETGGVGPGLD